MSLTLDKNQTLDRFAEQAGRLYSLPAVALKVLDLTERGDVDVPALKRCIECDPALTGKILRVVNSSLFGLSRQVSDLNQALALLGTKPLKLLVLGFSLPNTLTANLTGDILGHYWWHALNKAVAARHLAEQHWQFSGDEAFIAGLLQDLGMLVLIQGLGEPYVKFLEHIYATDGDVIAAERNSLGFDHFQLSGRLLEQWGLPRNIVRAVRGDTTDQKTSQSPNPLGEILPLAERAALLLTQQRPAVLQELLALVEGSGRMTRDDLSTLIQNLETTVEQLAAAMTLQLPHGEDYHRMVIRAQEQLAAATDDAMFALTEPHDQQNLSEAELLTLWGETMNLTAAVMAYTREIIPNGEAAPRTTVTRREPANFIPVAPPQKESVIVDDDFRMLSHGVLAPVACSSTELLREICEAVAECRQTRAPLSLLLVAIGHFDDWAMQQGTLAAERLAQSFQSLCKRVDHSQVDVHSVRAGCAAVLLLDCERTRAVELGQQLLRVVQNIVARDTNDDRLCVSLGVATIDLPAKNFPAQELIHAAERCLQSAQSGGGRAVKSIAVY